MKVSVVYAATINQSWLHVDVPDEATIEDAIKACGILTRYPEIDLKKMKVGVYGKLARLTQKLEEGNRVEIYRPITRVLDEDDDDDDDD